MFHNWLSACGSVYQRLLEAMLFAINTYFSCINKKANSTCTVILPLGTPRGVNTSGDLTQLHYGGEQNVQLFQYLLFAARQKPRRFYQDGFFSVFLRVKFFTGLRNSPSHRKLISTRMASGCTFVSGTPTINLMLKECFFLDRAVS